MSAPRRLRVAVLQRRFGARFGGAERYAVEMVRELRATHDIHVFAQEFEHDLTGIHTHQAPLALRRPRWLNQLVFALWTWSETRRGFDVVHSHEHTWHGNVQSVHVRPVRVGLMRGRGAWGRVLKRISVALSPRLLTYWVLEALRMRVMNRRRIVASSSAVRDEVLATWPDTREVLEVVAPGVRMPDAPPAMDRGAARAALGLPLDAMVARLALFVGNDPHKKGLPGLLQAMATQPDLHLLVVTAASQVQAAQAMAAQAAVTPRTHVIGSLADITQAYRAGDFLVHPTTEDTYAMVVLEAMAWSLPVIVSDARHCGIAAELQDGIDALLLADPHDSAALSGLITRLASDGVLVQRLREAGLAFARTRSWQERAQALQRIYAAVA